MYNLKVYFTIWSKSWFICDVIVYIGPQLRSFCAEQLNWYWRNLVKCRFSVNRCNGWNAIANAPFDDLREQNCWIRTKAKGHVLEKLLFAITKKALPKKSRFSKTCMVFLVIISFFRLHGLHVITKKSKTSSVHRLHQSNSGLHNTYSWFMFLCRWHIQFVICIHSFFWELIKLSRDGNATSVMLPI